MSDNSTANNISSGTENAPVDFIRAIVNEDIRSGNTSLKRYARVFRPNPTAICT